jgi:hypothetical protein
MKKLPEPGVAGAGSSFMLVAGVRCYLTTADASGSNGFVRMASENR